MASEKQMVANRKNAERSTGPKTGAGRRAIAGNAVKHGLLSRHVLLPGDDMAAFEALRRGMLEALKPVGELEDVLVDRVVHGLWRLQRLGLVETGLLLAARCDLEAEQATAEAQRCTRNDMAEMFTTLPHGDVTVIDEAAHAAALERGRQAAVRKEGDIPMLGRAFLAHEGTFAALSRYESNIERGAYKALHELQRLQAARSGQAVPLPVAADVDITLAVEGDVTSDPAKQSQSGGN
jgi:hypothetical protein